MTKIGNFINKQKEKLVQLLPYNAIINPVTKKPLNEEIVTSREAGTGGAPSLPFVPEAPIDGKQYARQDGAWSEVAQSGGSQWQFIEERILQSDTKSWDEYISENVDNLMIVIEFKGTSQNTAEGSSSCQAISNGIIQTRGVQFLNVIQYSTRVSGSILYFFVFETYKSNIIEARLLSEGGSNASNPLRGAYIANGIGVNGIHLWASGYFGAGSTMKFYKR